MSIAIAESLSGMPTIDAQSLGSPQFRRDYGLRYAYLAGAMYKGIASKELVIAMGESGMMAHLGTGGLDPDEVEKAVEFIRAKLSRTGRYGINILANMEHPESEERLVDVCLKHDIRSVEASAFMRVTPSLVRYRFQCLGSDGTDMQMRPRRLLAKVSRPEVASAFLEPAPEPIVRWLVQTGVLTESEATFSRTVPMADALCVEADSGGHTDQGVAFALLPAMLQLRDEKQRRYNYADPIAVGAAGGIGAPQAAAAAFVMGADFILTGSINQCTVEAGTSDAVKDLLQELSVQDVAYAPAGDMFEIGARVQVAKRGLFFPARANKLYELYQRHSCLEEIDPKTRQQIEERYFHRSFEDVWRETREYLAQVDERKAREIERSPKQKMAFVFKWYFVHTTRLALSGAPEQRVDYQVHCGPAMGTFNQWVKGTEFEDWRHRRVAEIGERLMLATAEILNLRFQAMTSA